jgi:hypothetical protein
MQKLRVLSAAAAFCVLLAGSGAAQTPPARPAADTATPQDTVPTGKLKPMPAFFLSLAVPGLSQAKLDRKLTTGLFVAWEGVSLGMTLKSAIELSYLTRVGADSAKINSKRQERQDWIVLLVFNHLFSGIEAYVSSHLQDFPVDVRFEAAPGRRLGVQGRIPFRLP